MALTQPIEPRRRLGGMRHRRASPVLLLALILVGCGAAQAPSAEPSGPLEAEGAWELTSGRAAGGEIPILDDHPITIVIEGSEIGGTAACNSYGGRLTITNGRLAIEELGQTLIGCEDDVAAAEIAYMSALPMVGSIARDGEELVLGGPGVELRFSPLPVPPTADMIDTAWVLDTLIVGDVAAAPIGEPAVLELRSDGTFSGSTGCRTFRGEWIEVGHQVQAPSWGMDQTECAPGVQGQDDHVVSVIGDGFVPSIEGDLLTLMDPGGVGLVYRVGE